MSEIYWKKFYHGTDKKTAAIILKEGFKRGTFFANHLEDAVHYGGTHVFAVSIKLPYDHTYWEYVSTNRIPARQIVDLHRYTKTKLQENKKLNDRMFKFNLKKTLGPKYRSHMSKCGAFKRYANRSNNKRAQKKTKTQTS
jgi:hypothetical protein